MEATEKKSSKKLKIFGSDLSVQQEIPYFEQGVSAGFPSPADDFLELKIDLNKELVKNPNATFYARVCGDSMKNAGLSNGDVLVIDKSIEPRDGKIAVCFVDGEFTVKRIRFEKKICWLMPENSKYQPLKITENTKFVIWGIVSYVIKKV